MTLDEYAKIAGQTAIYPDRGNNLMYAVLGLVGEAGELANQAKKIIRDDGGELSEFRRDKMMDEVGDVLWYVAAIAYELRVSLDQLADMNVSKLAARKNAGTLGGSGDAR